MVSAYKNTKTNARVVKDYLASLMYDTSSYALRASQWDCVWWGWGHLVQSVNWDPEAYPGRPRNEPPASPGSSSRLPSGGTCPKTSPGKRPGDIENRRLSRLRCRRAAAQQGAPSSQPGEWAPLLTLCLMGHSGGLKRELTLVTCICSFDDYLKLMAIRGVPDVDWPINLERCLSTQLCLQRYNGGIAADAAPSVGRMLYLSLTLEQEPETLDLLR